MAGPKSISPQGVLGLFRQHSDILSFFAITGGLLWVLRSRSMARKAIEEKQIEHGSGSTLEQGVSEKDPHTRR